MRAWWDGRRSRAADDSGNAIVEFLAVALILLVPIVYLVLVLGRVQAGTFAAEGAAREAGGAPARAQDPETGTALAVASVGVALRDQGFDDVDPSAALTLTCSSVPCLEPGSEVLAHVEVRVPLPLVPSFVRGVVPLEIPVTADHVAPVDRFRAAP
ncbi:pilus assembly protein [Cellulomonas sp. P22]